MKSEAQESNLVWTDGITPESVHRRGSLGGALCNLLPFNRRSRDSGQRWALRSPRQGDSRWRERREERQELRLSRLHKQNRGKLLEASIQCVIVQP